MAATRLWLSDREVSEDVVALDFPEWLETSMKGPGFFQWEVKPFSFRVHERCPVAPAVGLPGEVKIGGASRLRGMVSQVADAYSKTPEVTLLPYGGLLKDVPLGRVEPDDQGRLRWVFEVAPGTTIQAALEAALAGWAENKPLHFPAVDWTVEVTGDPADPVGVHAPHGITEGEFQGFPSDPRRDWTLAGVEPPAAFYGLRQDGLDALLGMRVLTEAGGNYTTNWNVWRFRPGQFENGDPEAVGLMSDAAFSAYDSLLGQESAAVDGDVVRTVAARLLNVPIDRVGFIGALDTGSGAWTFVRKSPNSDSEPTWCYAIWWADPSVQTIGGRWINWALADFVKLCALVSLRWLKIDGSDLVLPLRTGFIAERALPASGLALEMDQQDEQVTMPGFDVQLQDPDSDDPHGLAGYTDGQVSALNWLYSDSFSGIHRTTDATWPRALLPAGLTMLDRDPGYGTVTGIDWSTDGKRFRVKTVQEGA